jgi:amidase
LNDFRVGLVLDGEMVPVSGQVAALVANAVDVLARAGATLVEGWPGGVGPVEAGGRSAPG